MKTIENLGFQGDVMFRRVPASEVPKDAKPVERQAGMLVVAHSETGHHHVVRSPDVQLLATADPTTCYLRCEGPLQIEHLRPFDTHEPVELLGGPDDAWMVRRAREHTPEGWRMVED